jgi:outer membrane protease
MGASKGPWSLDLSLGTAVTEGSGIMEDYDWGDYTKTDWTNWSTSLIFLDKSVFLDISSSYTYELNSSFSFPLKLGYKLNYLDWEDKSGEYIYYWNFDPAVNDYYPTLQTGDFGGVNGIDYEVIQNIFYASAGILLTAGNVTTELNIALSPLIYAWDFDHHILRIEAPYFFLDKFLANFWYRTELSINIKMRSNEGLVFTLFWEELPEAVGNTYYFDKDPSNPEEVGDQTGYYHNGAGHASRLWGTELSYIWTF